jgi:hypothetical protein
MDVFKAAVSGVVLVALVTAVGLHGNALGGFVKNAGSASSNVLGTAEKG